VSGARLARLLALLSLLALAWALVVALTGGFFVRLGPVRLSSRNPWNPLLVALAGALVVGAMSRRPEIRAVLGAEWRRWWHLVDRLVRALGCVLRASGRAVRRRAGWMRGWAPVALAAVAPGVGIAGMVVDAYQWAAALPLWLDEEMIALNLRDRSFTELAGPLWLSQSAPYGWLVVQRAVLLTLGGGELALRLVPLLFGWATIAAALWVGRRWMGSLAALGLVLVCWIAQWLSHYRFEVKHYSADAFFGLLLPALAVWAMEGGSAKARVHRATVWWGVAAAAHWLANGALLVTPGCALVLLIGIWWRDGWRRSRAAAAGSLVWLATLAAHYQISLRHTGDLQAYWADRFPPPSLRVADAIGWLFERLEPLASHPGGTSLWPSLWLLAAAGLAAAARPALGAAFATVPISAAAYAFAGVVPLYDRFSIWIVPALYVGVTLLADRVVRFAHRAWANGLWLRLAVAVGLLALMFRLGADIVVRGTTDLDVPHPGDKHQLDDRAAVHWLLAQRQPGDVTMTTRFGLAALWWYGEISIRDEDGAGGRTREGGALYEMEYRRPGPACAGRPLEPVPGGARLLVYLGFRDVPAGFETLLMHTLDEVGARTGYREFAGLGRAVVVDPGARAPAEPSTHSRHVIGDALEGCVGVRPARRW
jgi:hypothetical protein